MPGGAIIVESIVCNSNSNSPLLDFHDFMLFYNRKYYGEEAAFLAAVEADLDRVLREMKAEARETDIRLVMKPAPSPDDCPSTDADALRRLEEDDLGAIFPSTEEGKKAQEELARTGRVPENFGFFVVQLGDRYVWGAGTELMQEPD